MYLIVCINVFILLFLLIRTFVCRVASKSTLLALNILLLVTITGCLHRRPWLLLTNKYFSILSGFGFLLNFIQVSSNINGSILLPLHWLLLYPICHQCIDLVHFLQSFLRFDRSCSHTLLNIGLELRISCRVQSVPKIHSYILIRHGSVLLIFVGLGRCIKAFTVRFKRFVLSLSACFILVLCCQLQKLLVSCLGYSLHAS
jgi:hypothetical protein